MKSDQPHKETQFITPSLSLIMLSKVSLLLKLISFVVMCEHKHFAAMQTHSNSK
jgi:hypothetical protein